MNKQQGFFFQKINPRIGIAIIIILTVFVGAESYWLSKSVSTQGGEEAFKNLVPKPTDTSSPLSEKDPRVLEKEAILRRWEQEDARKREEAFEEALKNPEKILDIQHWATDRNILYGFEYKLPPLGNDLGDIYASVEPGKLDPLNIQSDGVKIENSLLMRIGDRDWYWYTEQYSDYPYSPTCGVSVYQTGLDNKHHLEFVFSFCNPRERLVPGEFALSEKIISKMLPSFTFAFSEEELSNWKTYHDTKNGISFTYPPTYEVNIDQNGQIIISPSGIPDEGEYDPLFNPLTLGVTPFSKTIGFDVVAGTRKLDYNRDTNQWIVDGEPICFEPRPLGVQGIPSYSVGDGRTNHPKEYAVILPQGLLLLKDNLYARFTLSDILNTFTLDHPESVIQARCG